MFVEAVEELAGRHSANVTVDGCGSPLFAVSPHSLAAGPGPPPPRAPPAPPPPPGAARAGNPPEHRVAGALSVRTETASGTGRDAGGLMRAAPRLSATDGFEDVQVTTAPHCPTAGPPP
ncbi:asparaginase [Streptomyces roseus]|uniref:asparaginase n=1 Tax=Streptomyces roseus TaxID=66430 RepID=UPI0036B777FD